MCTLLTITDLACRQEASIIFLLVAGWLVWSVIGMFKRKR